MHIAAFGIVFWRHEDGIDAVAVSLIVLDPHISPFASALLLELFFCDINLSSEKKQLSCEWG